MTTYTLTESEHEELMNMAKVKNRVGILRLLSALEPNTQEPLTTEQYDELITQVTKNVPFSWRAFARAVEQAHGIGVKT